MINIGRRDIEELTIAKAQLEKVEKLFTILNIKYTALMQAHLVLTEELNYKDQLVEKQNEMIQSHKQEIRELRDYVKRH